MMKPEERMALGIGRLIESWLPPYWKMNMVTLSVHPLIEDDYSKLVPGITALGSGRAPAGSATPGGESHHAAGLRLAAVPGTVAKR
jgi:hypothetical protein